MQTTASTRHMLALDFIHEELRELVSSKLGTPVSFRVQRDACSREFDVGVVCRTCDRTLRSDLQERHGMPVIALDEPLLEVLARPRSRHEPTEATTLSNVELELGKRRIVASFYDITEEARRRALLEHVTGEMVDAIREVECDCIRAARPVPLLTLPAVHPLDRLLHVLQPEVRKHLGESIELYAVEDGDHAARIGGRCTACRSVHASTRLSLAVIEEMVMGLGRKGCDLEAELRDHGERMRVRGMVDLAAARVAQAMRPRACSCVRDVLAERARQG